MASVFSYENTSALPDMGSSHISRHAWYNVNNPGIAKLLSELNPHKACGPDQVGYTQQTILRCNNVTTTYSIRT